MLLKRFRLGLLHFGAFLLAFLESRLNFLVGFRLPLLQVFLPFLGMSFDFFGFFLHGRAIGCHLLSAFFELFLSLFEILLLLL